MAIEPVRVFFIVKSACLLSTCSKLSKLPLPDNVYMRPASNRTLGASFDKRVKTPCFPVLAIQSYWQVDGTVIIVENIAAKSRTVTEALGRPIAVYSCVRFVSDNFCLIVTFSMPGEDDL